MRAVDAAVALAEELGRRVVVLWVREAELNASFNDLFEPLADTVKVLEVPGKAARMVCMLALRLFVWLKPRGCFLDHREVGQLSGSTQLRDAVSGAPFVYMRTFSHFWPSLAPFTMFRPRAELKRKIERLDTAERVGVHVRRSDSELSIRHSPITAFIEAMHVELDHDNTTVFFVASDDAGVEQRLLDTFPGRIRLHAKTSRCREEVTGIQDAVVDLYALANCRKLVGSYWSSYTDVAWQIRGIEHQIIFEESGRGACEG